MAQELAVVFSTGNEATDQRIKDYVAGMEADAEVMAAVNKATTLDEFYDAAISYINVTFEEFKAQVMDLGSKAEQAMADALAQQEELGDEELDIVVGGSKIGRWFKKHWKKIAKIACAVVEIVGKVAELALEATPYAGVGKAIGLATECISKAGKAAINMCAA